jgi:hypothetical protein
MATRRSQNKEEVNAFYEMRERGDTEGKAYVEKMSVSGKPNERKQTPTSRG